jgi:hypothetical protein
MLSTTNALRAVLGAAAAFLEAARQLRGPLHVHEYEHARRRAMVSGETLCATDGLGETGAISELLPELALGLIGRVEDDDVEDDDNDKIDAALADAATVGVGARVALAAKLRPPADPLRLAERFGLAYLRWVDAEVEMQRRRYWSATLGLGCRVVALAPDIEAAKVLRRHLEWHLAGDPGGPQRSAEEIEEDMHAAVHPCSLEAEGLFCTMRGLIEESDRPGILRQNGRPMTEADLAQDCRVSVGVVYRLLHELEDAKVVVFRDHAWVSPAVARLAAARLAEHPYEVELLAQRVASFTAVQRRRRALDALTAREAADFTRAKFTRAKYHEHEQLLRLVKATKRCRACDWKRPSFFTFGKYRIKSASLNVEKHRRRTNAQRLLKSRPDPKNGAQHLWHVGRVLAVPAWAKKISAELLPEPLHEPLISRRTLNRAV